jgi:fatty-acyl-CoA synthase
MLGLMQNQPLLISSLIEFAERHHGDGEIVSRRVEGDIHRYTYRDLAARRQLANALDAAGVPAGDRVATLAWNGYRHMEMYFGVAARAACCTPSTRACTPSRSPGSSTTPKTRCCAST